MIIVHVSGLSALNKKQRFSHWIKKYYPKCAIYKSTDAERLKKRVKNLPFRQYNDKLARAASDLLQAEETFRWAPGGTNGKRPPACLGDIRAVGSVPGLEDSREGGQGNPL